MGRKKFRAAEKRVLHGDNIRTSRYSHRWGGMGAMKQDDIPIDPKEETP
jgi:hypothetical protein